MDRPPLRQHAWARYCGRLDAAGATTRLVNADKALRLMVVTAVSGETDVTQHKEHPYLRHSLGCRLGLYCPAPIDDEDGPAVGGYHAAVVPSLLRFRLLLRLRLQVLPVPDRHVQLVPVSQGNFDRPCCSPPPPSSNRHRHCGQGVALFQVRAINGGSSSSLTARAVGWSWALLLCQSGGVHRDIPWVGGW
jgi:hypothetical protein